MATILQCGSSRTYTTLAGAHAAIAEPPAGGYEVHLYNDSEFTDRFPTITGFTTSATDYIKITAAAGHSFQDHASVRSGNALFYDQTKGVGIFANPGSAGSIFNVEVDHVTIERLQIKRSVASYGHSIVTFDVNNQTGNRLKDCILVRTFSSTDGIPATIRSGKIINCLVVNTGANCSTGVLLVQNYGNFAEAINCTVINTGAAGSSNAFASSNGNDNAINNCAAFGFNAFVSGTAAGNRNATDLASGAPGANSLHSRTASNEFENTSNDFRLKTGSTLIGAGNTDGTNAANDITGYARGAGTAGDIGAWEASAAAANGLLLRRRRAA